MPLTMHRFHAPPELTRGPTIELSAEETHHALKVLRAQPGDDAVVLDGAGTELVCTIERCDRQHVTLRVRQRNRIPPLPFALTLVQAVPKGKTMDTIVQKATELGARRIVPVLSNRTVPQLEDERAESKTDKWRRTAIEAIKQCGSAWLPTIDAPATLQAWLDRRESFDLSLVASLQPGAQHPRQMIQEATSRLGRPGAAVAVHIGPEGDFTPAEIQSILAAGARPITLGPLVLRSDTAAIYALAVLSYELQTLTQP